ncbi:CocE/NonD family hydrolase [Methylobacterium sp. EM32]|uniref:CocE/NonD family hydrolase n=1 Tax=Methylobacterium sp. EM32 TaxID=3163481 RepID=UPI0033B6015B
MVVIGLAAVSPALADAADVVEQHLLLPVSIDGHDEQLEALIVRPAAEGRYPVALIVNGAFRHPRESQAAGLAHLAHDFAHRGWLAAVVVWRGYGTSTGTVQDDAGTCAAPDPGRYIDAHAADLAAALVSLRTRPDVEPAVAIGLGISVGGMSMLDLAARSDHPLAAVINMSGGLWHNAKPFAPDPTCGPFEDELVRKVGAMGRAAVPTLWLYALNDPWFQPEFARRMSAAYRQGGGTVDLRFLPPFEADGHTLYRWEANALTQPNIDDFLRAHGLPALVDDRVFAPVRPTLALDDQHLLDHYLRMPTEKALAVPASGPGAYYVYAERSMEAARRRALERCRAISRSTCDLVAENTTLTGKWRSLATRDALTIERSPAK